MPGLDTNVLVRWLVDDDPRQSAEVLKLFESVRTSGLSRFRIPVLCNWAHPPSSL